MGPLSRILRSEIWKVCAVQFFMACIYMILLDFAVFYPSINHVEDLNENVWSEHNRTLFHDFV